VRITPEKGSEPRQLKMSDRLIAMLNGLPKDTPKWMNSSRVRLKNIDGQAGATQFQCMTENVIHAAIKQTNRKIAILGFGGYPTENRSRFLIGLRLGI